MLDLREKQHIAGPSKPFGVTVRSLLLVTLLACGCAAQQTSKPTISPSQECHIVLDAICSNMSRCSEDSGLTPEEDYEFCLDFVMGKIPFEGEALNLRGACDEVTYANDNAAKCVLALVDSIDCEWPEVCDNVVMTGDSGNFFQDDK